MGNGVCLVCGVFVAVVVCDRAFNNSRAVTNSICLVSMASSLSTPSCVGGSIVLTIYVVAVFGI